MEIRTRSSRGESVRAGGAGLSAEAVRGRKIPAGSIAPAKRLRLRLRLRLAEKNKATEIPDNDDEISDTGSSTSYLERITVEIRGQRRFIPVGQIDYIVAEGPYAEIHAGDRTVVIRRRMRTLERQPDPARFHRIHRSAIVRLDRVEVLLIGTDGGYTVRLLDGTELRVARGRKEG